MEIIVNRVIFIACMTVIGLVIVFGIVAIIDPTFRKDAAILAPALAAPLVTIATAFAAMSRVRRANGDSRNYRLEDHDAENRISRSHPPPRQPNDPTPIEPEEGGS